MNDYQIPLMRNAFLNEENVRSELAQFILETNKFSMGEWCKRFEKEFAKWTGNKYAVLVNSGGSANLLMLQVLKNQKLLNTGDNIGFTSLTWSTNIFPIVQHGFNPIPIDIDPKLLNCTYESIVTSIEEFGLKAVFLTNVLGYSSDLPRVKKYCCDNDVILIEDNCESLGTKLYDGSLTGLSGLMSSHSFFVAHHMSTIEGGMVLTNDFEIYEQLKLSRANGWDRDLSEHTQKSLRSEYRIESEFKSKYTFYDIGFNIRPTEITGFLGVHQLKYLTHNIQKRVENYRYVIDRIGDNKDLIRLDDSYHKLISNFAMVFVFKNAQLKNKYLTRFQAATIEVRPVIAGNMTNQPFYEKYNLVKRSLPGTEHVDECGFYCGNYPDMTESDLELIIKCLEF